MKLNQINIFTGQLVLHNEFHFSPYSLSLSPFFFDNERFAF